MHQSGQGGNSLSARHRELQGLCPAPGIKLTTENSELGSSALPILPHLPFPFSFLSQAWSGTALCMAAAGASQAKRKQVTGGSCFPCPVPQKEVFCSQHRGSWWREVQEKHFCIQVMTKHLQIQPGSAELGSCREPRAASHHPNTQKPQQQGGHCPPHQHCSSE